VDGTTFMILGAVDRATGFIKLAFWVTEVVKKFFN
jgi:hypothetical protein